jgi:MFS-type transporter involved in bile tolerance (Atg22 family)
MALGGSLRRRLGLDSRASIGWALYDWANSGFTTTIVAAVSRSTIVDVRTDDRCTPDRRERA